MEADALAEVVDWLTWLRAAKQAKGDLLLVRTGQRRA
jgi:hypothetical protein